MRQQRPRWGIYVHNPDGDMGFGEIIGPYYDADRANAKANLIMRLDSYCEAIVLPMVEGSTAARGVVQRVMA